MSLTTYKKNNSLDLLLRPLPEIIQEKKENVQELKLVIDKSANNNNKQEYPPIDFLSHGVRELIKSASWEFNNIEPNPSSKYGREVDIYAVVGNDDNDNDDDNNDDNNDDNGEINIYDLVEEYRRQYKPTINITPLSVSVQSAKAKMTHSFDLSILAEIINKDIEVNINNCKNKNFSILGVLYQDIHNGIIKKPKPKKKGAFPNNMAILARSPMGTGKNVHMKFFKNSSISMVGCKIKEDGLAVTKILEQYIFKKQCLFESKKDRDKFKIKGFETTMVNSNYSVGFKIDRDRLFNYLHQKYKLFVSYDPAVYAAVKIGFYYNSIKNKDQDGICTCPGNTCTLNKSTSGKGSGEGIGQCKKVTIAVFESGNIVITGGRNIKQADEAYSYINNIFSSKAKKFALINLSDLFEYNIDKASDEDDLLK